MLNCPECGSNYLDIQDMAFQELEPVELALMPSRKLVGVNCFACGWIGSLSPEGIYKAKGAR